MNITPEQIPDEAARAALEKYYRMTGIKADSCIPYMKEALAAALPVLLVPVTFKYRRLGSVDPNEWYPCSRELYDAFHAGTTKSKDLEFIPLTYILPTPETPNAHP